MMEDRWSADQRLDRVAVVETAVTHVLARLRQSEQVLPDEAEALARVCGWQAIDRLREARISHYLPVLVERDILACLVDGCEAVEHGE